MYAGLFRWCSAIFGFIACFLQRVEFPCQPVAEHIRQKYAVGFHVERSRGRRTCLWHRHHLERLSAAQQVAVDLADPLQGLAGPVVVGDEVGDLGVPVLWHVIHLRAPTGVAHREIVLGAVTRAVGTLASWLAAGFVASDERAAQQAMKGRQLMHELPAAAAQEERGLAAQLLAHECQTMYIT